jgi:hypothetical protein
MIAPVTVARMGKSKISKAAADLGRLGGKARTAAKLAAVRANGKLGGRPVTLHKVAGIEVHADVALAERVNGRPGFRAGTPSAARWLERHGFERANPGERPIVWIKRAEGKL